MACTLARGTDVVFLDEPTLGLDVEASLELRRELRRLADEAVTVVLSSHDMDVIEDVCDRVVILSDGRVIADDPVTQLIDVFQTEAYQIAVEGTVPEAVRDRLETSFEVHDWTRTGDRTWFEVTLQDGAELYDVLERLRAGDCSLESVEMSAPDLEEVFLEMTDQGVPEREVSKA